MMSSNNVPSDPAEELYEIFSVRPILFLSALLTVGLWILLAYPIYFFPKIHVLPFLGFYFSYVMTFLILFVVVFVALSFWYRHNAYHLKIFSDAPVLGICPTHLVRRTGIQFIDFWGLLFGVIFSIASLAAPRVRFLFPLFLLISLSFLFALISGSSEKWIISRRNRIQMGLLLLLILIAVVGSVTAHFERRPKPRPSQPPKVPPQPSEENVDRDFAWTVEGTGQTHHLNCTIQVRTAEYEQAQAALLNGKPNKTWMRSDQECFDVAQKEITSEEFGSEGEEVQQVIAYLTDTADENYLSNFELSRIVLSFAQEQCIKYIRDKDSKGSEYFRFPIETVYDQEGDCDCKAILACACFRALGYDVALALMPGHAALAISLSDNMPSANFSYHGKLWYFCEATGSGWAPGAVPGSIDPSEVQLFEIENGR